MLRSNAELDARCWEESTVQRMPAFAPFLRFPLILRRATASPPSSLRRFASALPAPEAFANAPARRNVYAFLPATQQLAYHVSSLLFEF